MAANDTAAHEGLIALAKLFEKAMQELTPQSGEVPPAPGDGFLFSGNRHESVPRRLFLDRRLTPLERNAWQVFRLMLNDDGVTAFPTYEQLRPWLASMPCTGQASHETVARALTLLRLTRWLSLGRRRRDPNTGRILGNLYVLHDEPLTPFEAMQLDADYLALVSQSLGHSAKAVQLVAMNTLKEIAQDPMLSGRTLPSRLQVLAQRLANPNSVADQSCPQEDAVHNSEAGLKPASEAILRNPKSTSTVRSNRINEVRTTASTRAHALDELQWPARFTTLKAEQQAGVRMALRQVSDELQQAVLDEWAARCGKHGVRNPAAYLFGIIQRAIRGEFNAWAKQASPESSTPVAAVTPSAPPSRTTSPEMAQQHLEQLRELLRKT